MNHLPFYLWRTKFEIKRGKSPNYCHLDCSYFYMYFSYCHLDCSYFYMYFSLSVRRQKNLATSRPITVSTKLEKQECYNNNNQQNHSTNNEILLLAVVKKCSLLITSNLSPDELVSGVMLYSR